MAKVARFRRKTPHNPPMYWRRTERHTHTLRSLTCKLTWLTIKVKSKQNIGIGIGKQYMRYKL